MRKHEIENAAYEVAAQVQAVEQTIDAALTEIAELQSKMIRVRTVSGTGAATGHGAFEQLADAVQALVTARGGMVRCHSELVQARKLIPGLRTVGFGEGDDCPEIAHNELRIVA